MNWKLERNRKARPLKASPETKKMRKVLIKPAFHFSLACWREWVLGLRDGQFDLWSSTKRQFTSTRQDMDSSTFPSSDLAWLIKRHTHDVRNALNGMECELILLEENCTDAGTREAVNRLRQAGIEIGKLMQGLSAKIGMEPPGALAALQIAERWNIDARPIAAGVPLQWDIQLTDEIVRVDSGLIRSLLKEVLEMVIRSSSQRPLQITCRSEKAQVLFEISIPGESAFPPALRSQQAYWSALRWASGRGEIVLSPEILDAPFLIQFSLPLHRLAP